MKGKIAFVLLLFGIAILSNAHAGFEEDLASIEERAMQLEGVAIQETSVTEIAAKPTVPINVTARYNDYGIRISDMHSDGSLVSITVVNTGNYVLHDVNIAVAPSLPQCTGEPCPDIAPANQVIATINELYAGQKITINVWMDYKVGWAQVTTSEGVSDSFWLDSGSHTDLDARVDRLEQRVGNIEGLILDLINLIKRVIGISESQPIMQ